VSFFRAESQQARDNAWLGRIVLARPVSFAVLTACAAAIGVAIIAFLVWGEYTRKARLLGTLAPIDGVVRVVAQQSGRIESVAVSEGNEVREGDAMLALADSRAGRAHEDAAATVAARLGERHRSLRRQRAFLQAAAETDQLALRQRAQGLRREQEQLDMEIDSQARRTAIAGDGFGRVAGLEARGFVSQAARDRENDALLEQESRLQAIRRSRLALEREVRALEHEAAASAARTGAQLAAIDVQAAAVEQELFERGLQFRSAILAPAGGTVAAVLVERGQTVVAAGATLATIIPKGARLEAHLFSPSRSIGFVRAGQEVLLRYVAYPHQKFGAHRARIVAVGRSPLSPAELGFTPADGSREPVYRIKAELAAQSVPAYGREEALQPGMQVEADVMLDRRRLIEWIFEPLISLAGRT
jgi:membrane fusion protein